MYFLAVWNKITMATVNDLLIYTILAIKRDMRLNHLDDIFEFFVPEIYI